VVGADGITILPHTKAKRPLMLYAIRGELYSP
jgi:hypothetical protein